MGMGGFWAGASLAAYQQYLAACLGRPTWPSWKMRRAASTQEKRSTERCPYARCRASRIEYARGKGDDTVALAMDKLAVNLGVATWPH